VCPMQASTGYGLSRAAVERSAPALISVVIPMFNEQESVRPLLERLETTLRPLGIPFEIVAVDDGSRDGTRERLLAFPPLARELSVVCLSRNFGLEGAIEAGLRHARGDVVVLMDADLQDPPELVPTLLDAWRNGAEVVFTTKRTRAEPLARRAAFGGFHLLYHRIARIPSPLGAGNFSLIDRAAIEAMLALPERSRYLPGLRYWVGFRQVEVAYDRPERAAGRPSMSFSKLVKLALDGIFGFSNLPLRLATLLGALACILGVFLVGWVLVERFITHTAILGWPSLMIAVCFLGGAQLVSIGILGEYLSRVFDEVRKRPNYIVRDVLRPSAGVTGDAESPPVSLQTRRGGR
jgi:polyisoprenyl-phosphate glycosyltransferase